MARKTKQEALETRHSILDAAERLFQRQGVARTSLQQIAQEAQVTRGAIYWHFADKAELFAAMMDRATMPLEQGMNLHGDAALSLAELRWGLVNIFYATVHHERTRRVFEIAMYQVEFSGEMQAMKQRKLDAHRAWQEQNRQAFQQAVHLGQLPEQTDTRLAAIALVGLVDGLLHQWVSDPQGFDLLDVGRRAVDGFLHSLAPKAPPLPAISDEEWRRMASWTAHEEAGPPQNHA